MRNFILLITFLLIGGCASTAGNQSIKNETQQSIASKIIKARTTKQDILQQFGEPTRKTAVDLNCISRDLI